MNTHIRVKAPPADIDHLDDCDSYFISKYIGGALIEMGRYGDPRSAMAMCAEVGRWIEFEDFRWRSEDGRWLLATGFKDSERRRAA